MEVLVALLYYLLMALVILGGSWMAADAKAIGRNFKVWTAFYIMLGPIVGLFYYLTRINSKNGKTGK